MNGAQAVVLALVGIPVAIAVLSEALGMGPEQHWAAMEQAVAAGAGGSGVALAGMGGGPTIAVAMIITAILIAVSSR